MKRCEVTRSRLHVISFVLLATCTQSFAQNQKAKELEEEFYRLYPDLKAHNEVVRTAFEQLNQSGFQAKTQAKYERALAIKAYVLLNQSSGATMPYRQLLEEYNCARSEFPEMKEMSLPEFARDMNERTGSRAFDEGLNDNWLRRAGMRTDTSFVNSWGFVILVTVAGLILLVIVFRATSRSPKSPAQQEQSPFVGQSVWQRAMRPARAAATWGSLCGALSMSSLFHYNLSLGQRIGLLLGFSATLAIVFAVPVYLIAAFSYAIGASRKLADPSIDISFNCPRCGQHLCVEERGAGIAVKCPSCNEQIEIPRRTAPLTAPQPPPIAP